MALARTNILSEQSASNILAAAFTTSAQVTTAGQWLVVIGKSVSGSAISAANLTIADSKGNAYTPQLTFDQSGWGADDAAIRVWTALVTSAGSTTWTIDAGADSTDQYGVTVLSYAGPDTSGFGATASNLNSGTDGPLTLTLNAPPALTSEVIAVFLSDNSGAGVPTQTPGAAFTELYNVGTAGHAGSEVQVRSGSSSTSVDWVDINDTANVIAFSIAIAFEVKAAAGVGWDPRSAAPLWHPKAPRSFLRPSWPQVAGTATDLRQGAATAYLAVGASAAGTKIGQDGSRVAIGVKATAAGSKLASGAAVAAVGVSAKQAGSKLTGGSATAYLAVWAKAGGSKLISATAKAAVSVFAKQTGIKVGLGTGKAPVAVQAPAAGTKIGVGTAKASVAVTTSEAGTKTAQGSAKAPITVWAREAASKLTGGTGKAAIAVWAPAAGTKVGAAIEGSARAAISVFAKAAGTKIGSGVGAVPVTVEAKQAGSKITSGTAKAAIGVSAKQSATKIAQGAAKVSVAVFARQLGAKIAQGAARAALAIWSKVAGIVVDLTLGAGTGSTTLVGPFTSSHLAGPTMSSTLIEREDTATLAVPTTSTVLLPAETETTL